jgi:hypothetical protein
MIPLGIHVFCIEPWHAATQIRWIPSVPSWSSSASYPTVRTLPSGSPVLALSQFCLILVIFEKPITEATLHAEIGLLAEILMSLILAETGVLLAQLANRINAAEGAFQERSKTAVTKLPSRDLCLCPTPLPLLMHQLV